jgi:hypothetical protein
MLPSTNLNRGLSSPAQVLQMPRVRQCVQHGHRHDILRLQEARDEMRADEPCATGDKNRFHGTPPGEGVGQSERGDQPVGHSFRFGELECRTISFRLVRGARLSTRCPPAPPDLRDPLAPPGHRARR